MKKNSYIFIACMYCTANNVNENPGIIYPDLVQSCIMIKVEKDPHNNSLPEFLKQQNVEQ